MDVRDLGRVRAEPLLEDRLRVIQERDRLLELVAVAMSGVASEATHHAVSAESAPRSAATRGSVAQISLITASGSVSARDSARFLRSARGVTRSVGIGSVAQVGGIGTASAAAAHTAARIIAPKAPRARP